MEKRNKKTKFVTIETNGHISELGGIAGPILHPCLVDLDLVIQMVNNRKKVYEVNPNNPNEKVLLSLRNVRNENFPVYTADKKTIRCKNIRSALAIAKYYINEGSFN